MAGAGRFDRRRSVEPTISALSASRLGSFRLHYRFLRLPHLYFKSLSTYILFFVESARMAAERLVRLVRSLTPFFLSELRCAFLPRSQ